MASKVLTSDDVDQFIADGFVIVRNAFSPDVASRCREFLWNKAELKSDDPTGWTRNVVHIHECYDAAPFDKVMTDRIRGAFDDVMGEGRWKPHQYFGWWPISFPGFDSPPWKAPTNGWHVDGIQFHHHVDSREQGLLPIFLFSDIAPGGGGTALSKGSHVRTARILAAAEPDGLDVHELTRRVGQPEPGSEIEATGQAGDVVLIHPFILHARSPNTGSAVRFICNPCFQLHEKMDLNRFDASDYSPVERAIVHALRA